MRPRRTLGLSMLLGLARDMHNQYGKSYCPTFLQRHSNYQVSIPEILANWLCMSLANPSNMLKPEVRLGLTCCALPGPRRPVWLESESNR